jgi:hypothetical protein
MCCLAAVSALYVAATGATPVTVEGRVLDDHSGSPLASASVRIFQVSVRRVVADLETDRDGKFQASSLPPGDYRIEVSKPNHIATNLHVALAENAAPTTLLIHLVKCGVISGQVNDQRGHAVRGAHVFAMSKAPGDEFVPPFMDSKHGAFAAVDERGEYRLFNLPPGEYAVAVTFGASTMAMATTGSATTRADVGSGVLFFPSNARPEFFTVTGGEEFPGIDFTIAPAALYTVSGKVEPATQSGNFWLALTPPDQPALAVAVTVAQADGRFNFQGVPPGSYQLFASGPSIARGRGGMLGAAPLFGRSHINVDGENIDGISVTVQGGLSVSFDVRVKSYGQSEKPCPATAHLKLTPLEDWGADLERDVDMTFPGTQKLDQVAPARYRVRVVVPGDACYQVTSQILDLSSNADPGTIVIPVVPAGQIWGRLTTVLRPADFAVALLDSDSPDGGPSLRVALPDSESRFAFAALRPGRYYISAQPARDASRSRWVQNPAHMFAIDVAGGTTTNVELPVSAIESVPQ